MTRSRIEPLIYRVCGGALISNHSATGTIAHFCHADQQLAIDVREYLLYRNEPSQATKNYLCSNVGILSYYASNGYTPSTKEFYFSPALSQYKNVFIVLFHYRNVCPALILCRNTTKSMLVQLHGVNIMWVAFAFLSYFYVFSVPHYIVVLSFKSLRRSLTINWMCQITHSI